MHEISLIACLSKQKKEEEEKITAANQENSLYQNNIRAMSKEQTPDWLHSNICQNRWHKCTKQMKSVAVKGERKIAIFRNKDPAI